MKISSNYKFACILYKRAKFHHILKKLCLNYKNQLVNSVIWCFSDRASLYALVSSYQLNAQFLYSITIYMLHYNPRHVSSSTLLNFRRTNCIITASGIVTVCKQPYSTPVEIPLSTGVLYGTLHRVTIPDAVIIQFVLLKMSKILLETC